MIERIKELIDKLNIWRKEYYIDSNPSVSDAEYDKNFAELKELEEETGYIQPDSPTQTVGSAYVEYEVMDELGKIQHEIPMLSLENIFSVREVYDFVQKHGNCVLSLKMDGLSCRIVYDENGNIKYAATRGTGTEGSDVTHNIKMVKNVPQHIKNDGKPLIIDGEIISTWDNFENYNETLPNDKQFSHPRNFASGSILQLDNKICAQRNLTFVAWRVIEGIDVDSYFGTLKIASGKYTFTTVPAIMLTKDDSEAHIQANINNLKGNAQVNGYPYDGFVIAVDNLDYAKSLGVTSHHPLHSRALKEEQKPEKTILRKVEWNVGKSGLVAPKAIFDTVIIDGSEVSKATLYNPSIMKELKIGIGDEIEVIKAACIIPKIVANNTQSNTYEYPTNCPCCGTVLTHMIDEKSKVETLWCENENCPQKNLAKFKQFVSKQGMNIDGLSEKKLESLINAGYINSFTSIYHLNEHPEIKNLEGWGPTSYYKLIEAIEKSRTVKLNNLLVALSIPNVGKTVAKTIYKAFKGNFDMFMEALLNGYDFTVFDDIGDTINQSLHDWYSDDTAKSLEMDLFNELVFDTSDFDNVKTVDFATSSSGEFENFDSSFCQGNTFVVTGKFNHFKRDEVGQMIEDRGGKLASSVSKKTTYLLTNETAGTSKYNKAMELGIPIMSEEEFLDKIGVTY